MSEPYDVAVIGGGTVGCAFALAVARAGLTVLLVDRQPVAPPGVRDALDLRVSAMSPASERILNALGVWEEIETVRACPYRRMEIWDSAGSGSLTFESAEAGEPRLGHIVENRLAQGLLRNELTRHSHVHMRCPGGLLGFHVDGPLASLELDDGNIEQARLLVGADGGRSAVRGHSGIAASAWDYRQRAVVTHVATKEPHSQACYQRFLATGPVAFLPLLDGRSSIVWSTTPEEANRLTAMPEDEFSAALEQAVGGRLGAVSQVGERASFPLQYLHARRYVDERLALIGDAAHVVHPLAGQGVNLGLLDAAALAEVVVEAHRRRRDFGRVSELRRYERWRKGDNLVMANALHGLKHMFGSDDRALAFARNLGLNLVDELKPVKKLFMRQAAGLTGGLPRMASGEPL